MALPSYAVNGIAKNMTPGIQPPVKQIGADPNRQYALGAQPAQQPAQGAQQPSMPGSTTMNPAWQNRAGVGNASTPTNTSGEGAIGMTSDQMALAQKYGFTPQYASPYANEMVQQGVAEANRQKFKASEDAYNSSGQMQQRYANEFRAGLPQMQQQMGSQLTHQSDMQMNQNLRGLRQADSSRGLLYGGLHQGREGMVRAGSQANLAGAMTSLNSGLQGAANNMDQQAIQTGLGAQQLQQQMQNQAYSRALAEMSASNSMTGNVIGTGLMAGMLLA